MLASAAGAAAAVAGVGAGVAAGRAPGAAAGRAPAAALPAGPGRHQEGRADTRHARTAGNTWYNRRAGAGARRLRAGGRRGRRAQRPRHSRQTAGLAAVVFHSSYLLTKPLFYFVSFKRDLQPLYKIPHYSYNYIDWLMLDRTSSCL